MISYQDVKVCFGTFTALPGLELTIEEGEFFTLLGPSGCGKTTALRALAGFVEPASGEIVIAGKKVTKLAPDKREIGMVFQNYALFPSMSVRENIAFGLKVKRLPKAEVTERVNQIAAEVNLSSEQLDKNIAALSGGQQQRVAIARALVLRPKILLLDEPLSNLDAKLRVQLRGQLKDLQEQFGITTVYVTHDQEEALTLSDRIAVMNLGRLEQVGTPQQVYQDSATEFVCTFIGDVNTLLPVTIERLRTAGADLDPTRPAYLRSERADIADRGEAVRGTPMDGTVVSTAFHGLYASCKVAVGDDVIKIVSPPGPRHIRTVGQGVTIGIVPVDVQQYGAVT